MLGYASWHLVEKRVLKFKPKDKLRVLTGSEAAKPAALPSVNENIKSMSLDS
ncbi:hypothetical protein D3C86_2127490 [compost metagenome]